MGIWPACLIGEVFLACNVSPYDKPRTWWQDYISGLTALVFISVILYYTDWFHHINSILPTLILLNYYYDYPFMIPSYSKWLSDPNQLSKYVKYVGRMRFNVVALLHSYWPKHLKLSQIHTVILILNCCSPFPPTHTHTALSAAAVFSLCLTTWCFSQYYLPLQNQPVCYQNDYP